MTRLGETNRPSAGPWLAFAIVALTSAFVLFSCDPAKGATPKLPELHKVYTTKAFICQPCKALEAELTRRGVKIVGVCESGARGPQYFPKAVYSDGFSDSGQRVYNGQCGFARKVYVITWMEEKKK